MKNNKFELNQILEYIYEDRYKQAILIDGDWGTGKTYFIKKVLIPKLRERNKSVYYVSLYGVSSVNEVMNEIYSAIVSSYFESKFNKRKAKQVNKVLNVLKKTVVAGAGCFNINTKELPKLSDFKELEDVIIVFDDLERCEIHTNQVLGFINSFVEHDGIKIIIAANQKEIGKINRQKDLPNKYSVALNNNIKIENDKENNENNVYTKKELTKRIEVLFAEDSYYSEIKEKLIGLTINYSTDFDDVFEQIVGEYIIDNDSRRILLDNKKDIVKCFKINSHNNIRTLIFALISFEKFYKAICNVEVKPESSLLYEDEIKSVLEYTVYEAIQIRNGKLPQSWDDNIKHRKVYTGSKYIFDQSIYGYKFVDDYLTGCKYDKDKIEITISEIIKDKQKTDDLQREKESLSFYKMSEWWVFEDEVLSEMLNNLLRELKDNKYSPEQFKDILVDLMRMEDNGIDCFNYDDYVNAMIDYIDSYDGEIVRKDFEIISSDQEFAEEYNEIFSELFTSIDKRINAEKEVQNACLINHELWDDEFVKRCAQSAEIYLADKRFFAYIDPSILISQLKEANTKEIYNFLEGIRNVYDFSNLSDFYKVDSTNLELVLQQFDITMLANGKKTKEIGLKQLKLKLEEALKCIDSGVYWSYAVKDELVE